MPHSMRHSRKPRARNVDSISGSDARWIVPFATRHGIRRHGIKLLTAATPIIRQSVPFPFRGGIGQHVRGSAGWRIFRSHHVLSACVCCSYLRGYDATIVPPFGCSTCPLMYEASSLARNTMHGATSFGWPARFIGVLAPCLATLSGSNEAGIRGVQIGPGATALTLIPFSTSACESDRVMATIAPLVAE